MLWQTSLPDGKMSLPLHVEAEQAVLSQDVASQGSSRFLWTGLGVTVLMLIGVSGQAPHPLASKAFAEPTRLVTAAAYIPMPALGATSRGRGRGSFHRRPTASFHPAGQTGSRSARMMAPPENNEVSSGPSARTMAPSAKDERSSVSSSHDRLEAPSDGPTTKSDEHSEQAQASKLADVANEALNRKNYMAALGFAVAAAAVFHNVEAAHAISAALPPEALNQVDALNQVTVDSLVQQVDPSAVRLDGPSWSDRAAATTLDWGPILEKARQKALGGGEAGAASSLALVIPLMWLSTALNYEYRYGGNLTNALTVLYAEGGIGRLYQGLPFALVNYPVSRFGDVASQVGVLALLDGIPDTAGLPLALKIAAASLTSGLWRILCMPIDTAKVAAQVEGKAGSEKLWERVRKQGPGPLWQGALTNAGSTAAKDFVWFYTFNSLNGVLPPASKDEVLVSLIQAALVGISSSCVADTLTNPLNVIKTTQQTALLKGADPPPNPGGKVPEADGAETETLKRSGRLQNGESSKDASAVSIAEALALVLEKDGLPGLFGRGLQTKLLTNVIQGALFSVLLKYMQMQ